MKLNFEKDILNKATTLLKKIGLGEDEILRVFCVCKTLSIYKGDYFLQEGKLSDKIGLLLNGVLYAFNTNETGEKNISRFFYSPENIIVASFESFVTGSKSEETIECFEDANLIVISKADLYKLYDEIPKLNSVGRLLAEDSYIKALKKIKILQSKNASERIDILMSQSP